MPENLLDHEIRNSEMIQIAAQSTVVLLCSARSIFSVRLSQASAFLGPLLASIAISRRFCSFRGRKASRNLVLPGLISLRFRKSELGVILRLV